MHSSRLRNSSKFLCGFVLVALFVAAGLAVPSSVAQSRQSFLAAVGTESGNPLSTAATDAANRKANANPVTADTRKMVTTTVRVRAAVEATDTDEGYERGISSIEVEQSAGTFGDPARFMQLLPGVVSDNDERNDFIVRGGNPAETLFVIDNIEMPSINQLALSDTTGGFVSMIDNAAIQHTTLHTDAYDSKFDQRLSAVVEMSTRPEGPVGYHMRSEFGIGGTGASIERPLGRDGSMFASVRRSVLNLFTNDIGMNGVPIYNNGLVRADGRVDEKNNWWEMSLTGVDAMDIHPSLTDGEETNPFDISYKGWRNTTGINWQHIFSAKSFGVMSVGNSEQQQTIDDTTQDLFDAERNGLEAYAESSHDGITTLKYDWTLQSKGRITWTAGGQSSFDRMNYNVQQPIGLPNPYSVDPAPAVTMSIDRVFITGSSAGYGQAEVELPHGMKIVAGERLSQWAIVGSTAATGKVVFFAPMAGRMFHVGYAEYAQLPPSLYVLSFANHNALTPIHSRHLTAGITLADSRRVRATVNAYQKLYNDYPVSATFPQLSLANIADTFGQAFPMFPMTSRGKGVARGLEAAIDWRPARRLTVSSALTYMRSWYSGLDGVLRKGSFDTPIVANFSGNALLGKGWTASFRYSASTGKPYTPDDMPLSLAQNRDVYDLTRLNGVRAAMYRRLDFRAEWTHPVRHGSWSVHAGLENALGTTNFYSNQWMPWWKDQGSKVAQQNQMPRFPDIGVRYSY